MRSIFTEYFSNFNWTQAGFVVLAGLPVLIGIFYSTGFYQADELFQSFEFAQLICQNASDQYMPWEYGAQMRSTWMVWIAAFCIQAADIVGMDGKGALLIGRLITAVSGLVILFHFSKHLQGTVTTPGGKLAAKWLPLSFCILPFLLNRLSAEVISMYLLIGIFLLINRLNSKPKSTQLIAIGVLIGLAFFVRYAIILALVPLCIWGLIRLKLNWRALLSVALGITATVVVSIVLDSLFYGEITLAPYNYFQANFIENRAAHFGVYPWHFYYSGMLARLGWIGLISVVILCLGTLLKAKNTPFFWMILVSVIGFSLIGHKELRFLFSLVPFAIAGLAWLLDNIKPISVARPITFTIIMVNLFLGITIALTPADDGLSNVNSFISEEELAGPIFIQAIDIHPFSPHGLVSQTYSNPRLKCKFLENEQDIFQLPESSIVICHEDFLERLETEGIDFEILKKGYDSIFDKLHRRDIDNRVCLLKMK
jgi:phosphatidylinositol glycan class B